MGFCGGHVQKSLSLQLRLLDSSSLVFSLCCLVWALSLTYNNKIKNNYIIPNYEGVEGCTQRWAVVNRCCDIRMQGLCLCSFLQTTTPTTTVYNFLTTPPNPAPPMITSLVWTQSLFFQMSIPQAGFPKGRTISYSGEGYP